MIVPWKTASHQDVTAFILAGGKSTRMGTDKAFVEYEGHCCWRGHSTWPARFASGVWIVGSKEKFAGFAPVVEDIFCDCGPLGGIHAALRTSLTELNLMLAVDMPFVSRTFLQYLITQARDAPEASVIVPRSDGRRQPLCAIYRRKFAEIAENALRARTEQNRPIVR